MHVGCFAKWGIEETFLGQWLVGSVTRWLVASLRGGDEEGAGGEGG